VGEGNGADGVYAPSADGTFPTTATSAQGLQGTTAVTVGSSVGFAVGDLVLLHQTRGAGAGTWELGSIAAVTPATLTLALPLQSSYSNIAPNVAQAVRVAQYTNVTIAAPRIITAMPWNGQTGGIIAFFANGTVNITGTLHADGAGYRGGAGDGGRNACPGTPNAGWQGESSTGAGLRSSVANGAGGGGGQATATFCCSQCPATPGTTGDSGGGGGGYGTPGGMGQGSTPPGQGGGSVGPADLSAIFFGGGGGGGAGNCTASSPAGAAGGGAIYIAAAVLNAPTGAVISARGASAGINGPDNWEGGGGGGAGGALVISARAATLGTAVLDATGGNGSVQCAGAAGNGGVGRVRVACGTLNGATCPASGAAVSTPTPDVTAFCAFDGCSVGSDCPIAAPVCDPATRSCVQCDGDSECAAPMVCDVAKHACGACALGKLVNCTGTVPTCNTAPATDVCAACNGNFGGSATRPCPTGADPICVTGGANAGACLVCNTFADCSGAAPVCSGANVCVACDGDDGTGATNACPTATSPYCKASGACGLCASDMDCTAPGVHGGRFCMAATGACGNLCSTDAECAAGSWCNDLSGPGMCQSKVSNGQAVPGSTCTASVGMRACASGVCDMDNKCGYATGDGTCATGDAGNGMAVCRSGVCASSGANQDKCVQCQADTDCSGTTPACDAASNTCVPCTSTNVTACPAGMPICDVGSHSCEAGTRDAGPDAAADAGGDAQATPEGATEAADAADAANGEGDDAENGSDTSNAGAETGSLPPAAQGGTIEGGGLSCSMSRVSRHADVAPAALVLGTLLFGIVRRRNGNRARRRRIETSLPDAASGIAPCRSRLERLGVRTEAYDEPSAAGPAGVVHPKIAAMRACDATRDGEAETGTARVGAGRWGSKKWLEDAFANFGRYAGPLIAHEETDPVCARLRLDPDDPTARRMADGIFDQIADQTL
jgi:hypothetical protein